ncbi:hypothetical protein [Sulfurimonas sp.]|uniref:hypothetical protein n=1 Tax=Sulfurimonas sp. TaxID=2022749 RepID=UPI002B4AA692|nr:hypothetical protein [Sulfurimonas sp.]
MRKKEFLKIFKEGFELDSVEGYRSQLKCFICHERTGLRRINRRWKIRCRNKHTFELIDYTTTHIMARDGLLKKQLKNLCMFNF